MSNLFWVVSLPFIMGAVASDSDDITKFTLTVGMDQFTAYLPAGYKKSPMFKGYFVELDKVTGCGESLEINGLQADEVNENKFVTYIDWYDNDSDLCEFSEVVDNLLYINISHFVMAVRSSDLLSTYNVKEHEKVSFLFLTNPHNQLTGFKSKVGTNNKLVDINVEVHKDTEENTSIPMSSMAILFVTVAFVTLMTVSIGWLVFYYAQRCRQRNMRERLQSRLCVAAKRAVSKLPSKVVPDHPKNNKKAKGVLKMSPPPDNDSTCSSCSSDEGDFCPVCLDLYKPREVIRILPCKHEFHKNCVDPWLFDHRTCPMCKLDILEHLGMPAAGDRLVTPSVNPPEYSENISTRVDQEVQTDFVNTSPHNVVISDEIEPAPISPPPI